MEFKNKYEIIANKGIIFILAKLVCGNTPLEYRNYNDFMNKFNLHLDLNLLLKISLRRYKHTCNN